VIGVAMPADAPLARLDEVKADPTTMSVISQRVAEGETLKEIALAWQVPAGLLLRWVQEDDERWAEYERSLALRADALIAETVAISDEQNEVVKENGQTFDPDVPRDKLRIDTRLKVAARYDRRRFGNTDSEGGGGGGLKVVVVRFPEAGAGGGLPEITAISSSGER
jgi:hypothetical protein